MKRRIVIVLLLVGLAFWVGRLRGAPTNGERLPADAGSGREETRQSFQLSPGASVEVRGINGRVEIETADTDIAEVHIVRTADNKSDLERQRIVITQTPESLVVRSDNSGSSWWENLWHRGNSIRQQVSLKIPRKSDVKARGINGPVEVGEVEGGVEMSGINGRVEVASASGHSEIAGVNGNVSIGLSRLDEDGVRVSGVNGGVEFRLGGEVNAEVKVNGLNGGLSVDAPTMVVEQQLRHSRMRARIGAGGPPVSVSGINGNLSFQGVAADSSRER